MREHHIHVAVADIECVALLKTVLRDHRLERFRRGLAGEFVPLTPRAQKGVMRIERREDLGHKSIGLIGDHGRGDSIRSQSVEQRCNAVIGDGIIPAMVGVICLKRRLDPHCALGGVGVRHGVAHQTIDTVTDEVAVLLHRITRQPFPAQCGVHRRAEVFEGIGKGAVQIKYNQFHYRHSPLRERRRFHERIPALR